MTLWPPGWDSDHLEHDRQPVPPGEAARRLRRRGWVINAALIVYPLVSLLAVAGLAVAYFGANARADRVVRSLNDVARFDNEARAYIACISDPTCPPERRAFLLHEFAGDTTSTPAGETPGVPKPTTPPSSSAPAATLAPRPSTPTTAAQARPRSDQPRSTGPTATTVPAPTTTTTRPQLLCLLGRCIGGTP